ncbi:MAG: AMP-binding protein [Rhodoglobus sp.]
MPRPLRVVDSTDVPAVMAGLRDALWGGGPAIFPHPAVPRAVPATVDQRVAVVVESSGSTGTPKRVCLSADAVLASAAASDARLGPGQWLMALPAHYIAGLAVLVRSLSSSSSPVVIAPGESSGPAFVAAAQELDSAARFVSLVPVQLARLMERDDAVQQLRRFDRILLGGQSTPRPLLDRAQEFGLAVTCTYGSTETSGGCVWDGLPIGDARVRIVDGRIHLSGSMLAHGYLGSPHRTAEAFLQEREQRWYRTDDTGSLVDGLLVVGARVDDVTISGGMKFSLAEVEAVVRRLPGLDDAVVVAVPHPPWGEVVVVVSAVAMPLEELRGAVAASVGRAAAPARLLLVETIPLLASGKPDRLALTEWARGA